MAEQAYSVIRELKRIRQKALFLEDVLLMRGSEQPFDMICDDEDVTSQAGLIEVVGDIGRDLGKIIDAMKESSRPPEGENNATP